MASKIPVRATAAGFYLARRRPGEEFAIPEELFAAEWMERIDTPPPPPAENKDAEPAPTGEGDASPSN